MLFFPCGLPPCLYVIYHWTLYFISFNFDNLSHVQTSVFLQLSLYVEATLPTALSSRMFGWRIRISDACYLTGLLDGNKI